MPDELAAGRELDALMAEKIMGWVIERLPMRLVIRPPEGVPVFATEVSPGRPHDDVSFDPWWQWANGLSHYSTDIAAALEVMEKMASCQPRLERYVLPDRWVCRMQIAAGMIGFVEAQGDSAPLAICRAALLAVQPPTIGPTTTVES